MRQHRGLYHQEILSRDEAARMHLHVWRILRERIEPGGAVLPHRHDVTEVIHFVRGEVDVLLRTTRLICRPGDSLIVPAGTVHGVANGSPVPSEQVSFFIPSRDAENFGHTEMIAGIAL